jgi:diguanylate cyclase (GGDEF)-like protein/putative nucleotidyltransferase with HDIG domain
VLTQLYFWLIASVLLVVTFGFRAYRANRTLQRRLEQERLRAEKLGELHLATIEALALAIDAKDQTTHNHVRRVELYAVSLARELGMSEIEIEALRTAALLHDIGKLGVPEQILAKPGPLTPDEFQKVRMHPQIGADILSAVPFPYPVAPLVLGHHERWDGRGYPLGLKGDEIPLGARILCLVDYFDALTSDRPYHKPLPVEAAAALIQEEAGKALDPAAVETFLRILPDLRAQAEIAISDRPRIALPITPSEGAPIAGTPRAAMVRQSVFEDIAVAHREIYALYELAQSMGTTLGVSETMGHISSKLSRVVPFSACSLFLYSEDDDALQCRFAAGTDSELLQQLVLKGGQGLTGWVARNRRPLVNGRPSADFHAAGSVLQTVLESALVCPLVSGNAVIGTLAVYHTEEAFYCDDHRRLLDRVCEQASAVIRNAIVFDQTHEASLTDPLTGLPNTRFMFRHLTRELARTHRLGAETSLLVLDLDGFKDINDTYGHNAGDQALRAVSSVLRTLIRPYDVVARYAGDEFVIVLAGCSREEAENKRRELQIGVEQIMFEPMSGVRVPLSISAGAAVFPHDGDTYETLLAAADRRMYQDKSVRRITRSVRLQADNSDKPNTQQALPTERLDITPASDYEITAV